MKKRVFIYTPCKYPRGGANANYVQYLSSAFAFAGYKTYVLAKINEEYSSKHINVESELLPLKTHGNKIINHYLETTGYWNQIKRYLIQLEAGENDLFIILGYNIYNTKSLIKFKKKHGLKIGIGILELFEEKDFEGRHPRKSFKQTNKIMTSLCPEFDILFPISTYIEEYMKAAKVEQMVLPIMADIDEYKEVDTTKTFEKWKFIIPANGKMKDNLSTMVRCFSNLSENELMKVEVHFCGVKKENIVDCLENANYEKVKDIFIVHDWMEYEELVQLYAKVHFLLLTRTTSQMTLANFPSKIPEVMSYGIVPIASEVGDYTKYYLEDNTNSIFIKGDSEENCLRAVKRALEMTKNEYMELSENAKQCVKNKFDYHVWIKPLQRAMKKIGL